MISTKKLIKFARKWHKLVVIKRKRIELPHTNGTTDTSSCSTSGKAEKGCFVVYSADQKRFLLPLEYLNSEIIKELFNMAEDEFGLPANGPLTLPCDSQLMEYAIDLIKRRVTGDVEKTLLTCIASCGNNSLSYHLQHQITRHQSPICSF
ncbi:auxin-responsive protein SAUR68-like [Euphorbia lathyris]|uniref:auxin-responsive protein SAUR68-like n=1 Tax=Euphorbia lathyris TaxID=212925 RepID=UPI0033132EC6